MKIIIIPETEEEKARIPIAEHEHVGEFMLFGNKVTPESGLADFHDWRGSYRHLITGLAWYTEEVKEARRIEILKAEEAAKLAQSSKSGGGPAIPLAQAPVGPFVQPPITQHIEPVVMAPVDPVEDPDPSPVIAMEKDEQ